eukprot:gene10776-12554_t
MHLVTITSGATFNSKFGSFKHKRLIGMEYGSKVASEEGQGFMHILTLTPELWSLTLDHRTQILFNLDISTIIFNLEVKNGSKVVESGTGSGSLSTSFARTLAPKGHLYTFEFHEERVRHARADFTENRISDYITVTHRNVCKEGFKLPGLVPEMIGHIDAVFLDLPSPWEAIDHAADVMREGEGDFEEIKTIEVLIRNVDMRIQEDEELFLENPYQKFEGKLKDTGDASNAGEADKQKRKKKWEQGKIESFDVGNCQGEKTFKLMAKPVNEERGHTGYLTFARYMPKSL